MLNSFAFRRHYIHLFTVGVYLLMNGYSLADEKDALKHAKHVIEEVKKYEMEERKELRELIEQKEKELRKRLIELAGKANSEGNMRRAMMIRRLLQNKESLLQQRQLLELNDESEIIKYGHQYLLLSNEAKGELLFSPDGTVKMNMRLLGKDVDKKLEYEEKEDHLVINGGEALGRIFVSAQPNTERESLFIRFGSKLKHLVVKTEE